MKKIALLLLFVMTTTSVFAQENENMEELVEGTKNDLMLVIGGGLAGAVLGLSTLSFVDEPKNHTKNIIVGASLGIILGVGAVAFSQANKSREMMYQEDEAQLEASKNSIKTFDTYARSSWHIDENFQKNSSIVTPYQLQLSINY